MGTIFRRSRNVLALALIFIVWSGVSGGGSAPAEAGGSLAARCDATLVHYKPYEGVQSGLAPIPWIAASPASTGLVGHLFYYDGFSVWKQRQLPLFRIYAGGQSPDGRVNMKILWELRHGSARAGLRIHGRRLDSPGSFSEQLQGGGVQFPSIVDVPSRGCWRLTLATGRIVAKVVVLAVARKTS